MNDTEWFGAGQMMAGFAISYAARSAPASADPAISAVLSQLLKGQAVMAVDLSSLQADVKSLIEKEQQVVSQLTTAQTQVADLQAKLAATPHDDPTVQTAVDALDATVKAALATASDAPAEPPALVTPVVTTPEPVAATPAAPAAPDPAAPTGTETAI